MTRRLVTVLILLPLAVSLTFAAAGGEDPEGDSLYRIGYIQGGADAYYQMQADAARLVVEYINENEPFDLEFNVFFHEGRPERELSIVEDFIAQGMDAVIVFTSAAEAAQRGAQLANEADVPFFVVGSTPADGPGQVTSNIKGDFVIMGGLIGQYVAENYPESKIAILQGALGQGIAEPFEDGFRENLASTNEVLITAPADWSAERAQNIMTDWLANWEPGDFDLVYAMNADIYLGAVAAVEDAGLLNDPIKFITHNGRPEDFEAVMEGRAIATNANSPTYEAGVLMKAVVQVLTGGTVPQLIITPSTMVDVDTPENLLGWGLDRGVVAYQEYEIPSE